MIARPKQPPKDFILFILSIYQHQHRRILCRFDHLLKLPVRRDWFFQLGGNRRHGFEEW